MATNSMNLDLPTVDSTPGPEWATDVNTALTDVAEHDHSSGNGVKITPAGMNIIADLAFNNNNATGLRSARLASQGALVNGPADLGCIVNVNGDLWWVNSAGTGVQLTTGGAINIASVGTIGGDYGQPGVAASVAYSSTTKTFTFLQGSGQAAQMFTGTINIASEANGALSVAIKAASATTSYAITLPLAAPGADTVLTFDATGQATFRTIVGTAGEVTVAASGTSHQVGLPAVVTKDLTFSGAHIVSGAENHSGAETHSGPVTFTGATAGRGILPLGAVIATMPHLTGAYACVATTAADANGFVQCAGQTIVDPTSPMNGAVIPTINNNVFLMGHVTSGTAGGANSKTLSGAEIPAHVHGMGHGHGNSFALTGTTSFASTAHTHDHSHSHQWTARFRTDANVTTDYSVTSPNSSLSTWSTSGTGVGTVASLGASTFSGSLFQYTYAPNPLPVPVGSGVNRNYTGGPIDNSGNLVSNTGGPSATGSVGLTGAVTDYAGVTTSVGADAAFDIRPSYISARYVMRVK